MKLGVSSYSFSQYMYKTGANYFEICDIAKRIGKSPAYIYSRMAGLEPWAQSEMYSLLDMIHEPYRKMHIYFPLGGVWAGPAEDPPLSTEQQIAALLCKMVREGATA